MGQEEGEAQRNDQEEEETPEVDIHINNVVCNFSTRCHLNLRQIATQGFNVVYKREQGMVSMKLRDPAVTASIWSSGKITVTGATSNEEAKKGARRVARILQNLGFKVKFSSYRVVNVLGTVILPFGIKITQFTENNRTLCSYEPELHPGATYKFKEAKATLKIFQTGSITITAPSILCVQQAVEHIYPLVYEFKKDKPPMHGAIFPTEVAKNCKRKQTKKKGGNKRRNDKRLKFNGYNDDEEEVANLSSEEEASFSEDSEEDVAVDDYSDKSD